MIADSNRPEASVTGKFRRITPYQINFIYCADEAMLQSRVDTAIVEYPNTRCVREMKGFDLCEMFHMLTNSVL